MAEYRNTGSLSFVSKSGMTADGPTVETIKPGEVGTISKDPESSPKLKAAIDAGWLVPAKASAERRTSVPTVATNYPRAAAKKSAPAKAKRGSRKG